MSMMPLLTMIAAEGVPDTAERGMAEYLSLIHI